MGTLPQRVYTAAQVRELDRRTIEDHGVPGYDLMNRAARATFDALQEHWPTGPVTVVCGAGNNAGDGYVVARLAKNAGREVVVHALVDPAKLSGDAATAYADFESVEGQVTAWGGSLKATTGIIVDGLLGTGLDREVGGVFGDAVRAINESNLPIVALDIPSGLHADTGAVMGVAVDADLTVTFVGMKQGLLTGRGPALCGELVFDSLGAPREAYDLGEPITRRIDPTIVDQLLPRRPRDAHKGMSGHVLVIGGGPGMAGAARLAGESALRAGAGLVSIATLARHAPVISGARPELMAAAVESTAALETLMKRTTILAIGPGLGRDDWAREMFEAALASDLPLVVDADALNLLAESPVRRSNWVLTPHPGEAARLLDSDTPAIQGNRFAAASEISSRFDATVVLKGAGTIVRDIDSGVWICDHGNPGMAVAGMGDVLTGVIAGIAAQCGDLESASRCGVLVHAMAGDDAVADAGERGLLASDLFPFVRQRLNRD